MFRNILLAIPKRWLGPPQAPDQAAFTPGRTRLPAWLSGSRWSPVPAHPRGKKKAAKGRIPLMVPVDSPPHG